uniref:Two component response regulator CusR2 n=2 Tax=Acidithiobacillus thiooxidans TaxID=930 RepID=B7SUU8_ACITH|nr:two component response regulator CusR2 [Acidithiobacillus thiooxidans]
MWGVTLKMRILLVEDDRMIGEAISVALRDAAYAVDWTRDGETALQAITNQEYQAILLDLGLPKLDGCTVLQRVRAMGSDLPIIIISARDALSDRIEGLDLGADDYLVKPFAMDELLARLRAIIRRQGGQRSPVLSSGSLQLDLSTHIAQLGEASVLLSRREFALLQALLLRPGAILSRAQLEERLYGWGEEIESNSIDFLIHALRKKLGAEVIKNVRGAGWMVSRPL